MWLELRLQIDPRDSDLVADLLAQCCPRLAVEIDNGEEGQPRAFVKIYVPQEDLTALKRSLRLALRFVPLSCTPKWHRARRLREERWHKAWRRHFRPQLIGSVLVKPPWSKKKGQPGQVTLQIEPGMAFGTGTHPTTALCLHAVQKLIFPGARVLDVGTGTGILAIAAAKLGATYALALDIDAEAVKAALGNVEANGVADTVKVCHGTLTPNILQEGPFHLVIANLDRETIRRLGPLMTAALAPGGYLVVSGFLSETVAELTPLLATYGLRHHQDMMQDGWAAIVMVKDA